MVYFQYSITILFVTLSILHTQLCTNIMQQPTELKESLYSIVPAINSYQHIF